MEKSALPTPTLLIEPPDSEAATWCLAQYFAELAALFDQGYEPARAQPVDITDMRPPKGWFIVARVQDNPLGCGMLKRVNTTTGEIKRVWISPAARGQGLGRAIMMRLEQIARDAGLMQVRLDSNAKLEAAQALYRKLGYHEVTRFNDDPYPTHFFARML
jgi:GNAT superfamily N-acetyltransferase